MPEATWTKAELDTLLKALSSVHLPLKAKRDIKTQVRSLCLDAGTGTFDSALCRLIFQNLGYDELPPRTLKKSKKAT